MNLRRASVKLDQLLSAPASRSSHSENAVEIIEGNQELELVPRIHSSSRTEGLVDRFELKMRGRLRLD